MEKYNDYTSILKQFDEKMEKFNIEGQELSSINTAISQMMIFINACYNN